MVKKFWVSIGLLGLLFGCANSSELQPVRTEQAGEYTVTVLSETGSIKNGASDFVLEFRKTADNQPADVGAVEVAPVMDMPGMSPMIGAATTTPGDAPGRYRVKSNLSMAGLWKFNVKFGNGQSVRINLTAE
ncbi:MAG TPA: FixH family protein [Terriglobia bacterium]|nr:FixH family protein [Terriglobia bacterium]